MCAMNYLVVLKLVQKSVYYEFSTTVFPYRTLALNCRLWLNLIKFNMEVCMFVLKYEIHILTDFLYLINFLLAFGCQIFQISGY